METPSQPSTPSESQGTTPTADNPFAAAPPAEPSPAHSPAPSAAPAAVPAPPAGGSPESTPQAEPTEQPSQTPSAPQPPALSPDARAIADAIIQAQNRQPQQQPATTQQPPAQMSPEEFNKTYGIPVADAKTYEAIFGIAPDTPERVTAFNQFMHSMIRPSVLMARDIFEAKLSEMESKYQPMVAAYQEHQNRAHTESFYKANPDLVGYEGLINEIRDAHVARGKKFTSQAEAFKSVADTARQILKQTAPKGAAPAQAPAGGQTNQPSGNPPVVRQMTPSAQGGRGGTPSAAPKKSTPELIFGG